MTIIRTNIMLQINNGCVIAELNDEFVIVITINIEQYTNPFDGKSNRFLILFKV